MERKSYTSHAIFALAVWLIIAALIMFVEQAHATVFSWDYNYEYTGATPPAGSAPWLNVTIDDEVAPGNVAIGITSYLTDVEYVNNMLFNFEGTGIPLTSDDFIYLPSSGPTPTVSVGDNEYHAGGDGWFDIQFEFDEANSGDRFGPGEYVSFLVTRPDITAEAFNHVSALGPTQWLSVAHVGGIAPDGQNSGWITVTDIPRGHTPEPDPGTLLFLGIVLMGVGAFVNHKYKPETGIKDSYNL